MKYELGDKVKIRKYWRRKSLPAHLEEQLKQEEEEVIKFDKYELVECDEIGYIAGARSLKVSTSLVWTFEDSVDTGLRTISEFEGVRQTDSDHVDIYLVATRMNCFRRVNKSDMELIRDVNQIHN
ncbi:hypothetical protein JH67_02905 [Listeria monocytogenes]|nr:hypothetical protein [Listeria monocytogenes]